MGRVGIARVIAVDTSAILAIVFGESERDAFVDVIERAGRALVAAPTLLESRMVVYGRKGPRAVALLDRMLREPGFETVATGQAEIAIAGDAFIAFGKGSGHPAALNFGDVFAYALAKSRRVPLLYKGDDFPLTDVEPAWEPPTDRP